jgi:hypothetical protein
MQTNCRYLASPKARWTLLEADHASPFVFDARRAVQLAKKHNKREVGWQLLLEIGAYEEALALSSTYEERLAVIEEVHIDPQGLPSRPCTTAHSVSLSETFLKGITVALPVF